MTHDHPPTPSGGPTLEDRLMRLPLRSAPDGLWEGVQTRLRAPESVASWWRRPLRSPILLAAAASVVAVLGGTYVGVHITYGAPSQWAVQTVAGAPIVAGQAIDGAGALRSGEWLVTDGESHADLAVGKIGTARVGPHSRVRLESGSRLAHRLTLERGSINAVITAPPRLFFVETPAALATDLGCAYTLDVDSAGTSRIRVTSGWVELARGGRRSLVPAGLSAVVEVGGAPGTPYPDDFPSLARAALHRIDAGRPGATDLALVLVSLSDPAATLAARRAGATTLWHLLPRVATADRSRVFDRLVDLSPPPERVTREGILALDRPMLERWRRDLIPMWSEEAQPWFVRVARHLWMWTIR